MRAIWINCMGTDNVMMAAVFAEGEPSLRGGGRTRGLSKV